MPVCILGMHRSGTSMVANLLKECGLDLGPEDEMMPPHESNPGGFFENINLCRLNESLFEHFGASWDRPPRLPAGWENDAALKEIADKAASLLARLSGKGTWGWKDPRTSLLLPFWKNLVPDLRFVICLRNPLEVARSLYARDRIDLAKGLSLWRHYTLESLRGTEGCPRVVVFYDDFFWRPSREAARLAAFCGLPASRQVSPKAVAKAELKHQISSFAAFLEEKRVPRGHKFFYFALHDLVSSLPGGLEIAGEASSLAAAWEQASSLSSQSEGTEAAALRGAYDELGRQHAEARRELQEFRENLSALQIHWRQAMERRDKAEKETTNLRTELEQLKSTKAWRLAQGWWALGGILAAAANKAVRNLPGLGGASPRQAGGLVFNIDTNLGPAVETCAGGVLHISGWCFQGDKPLRGLEIDAGSGWQKVAYHSLPRPDVAKAHPQAQASLLSGFHAFLKLPRGRSGRVPLRLRAWLAGGGLAEAPEGSLVYKASTPPPEPVPGTGLLAICMATFNPDMDLFRRQIASIQFQSYRRWICLVQDDASRPDIYAEMQKLLAADPRFQIRRNDTNLGFYRNFEKCLGRVPPEAEAVALSDQDDYWDPDKLETLRLELEGGAVLAYSDMRITDARGKVLFPSYWMRRRNQYRSLSRLLLANTVTGAASLFNAGLLRDILPFPQPMNEAYHDHWLACVAACRGRIAYVDRPLYSYTQHGRNVIGHYQEPSDMTLSRVIRALWNYKRAPEALKSLAHQGVGVFQGDLLRINLMAGVLRYRIRTATPAKRLVLWAYSRLGHSPAFLAFLWAQGFFSRRITLGAESRLFCGWLLTRLACLHLRRRKRAIPGLLGGPHPNVREEAAFVLRANPGSPRVDPVFGPHEPVTRKMAPLNLKQGAGQPRRLNFLIPTLDFRLFFGGYIAKFNLALAMAEQGFKVRMVTLDACQIDTAVAKAELRKYGSHLADFFEKVELVHAHDRLPLAVSPQDDFLATTWWTAHVAHQACRALNRRRFLYLIQEYEPVTFPLGTYYALATQSYRFPHFAIFSTEFLREYFSENRIGIYAPGGDGDTGGVSFQNAILQFSLKPEAMKARRPKKLLFYSRPEPHASRNMFEFGMAALDSSLEQGVFHPDEWSFFGIGSTEYVGKIIINRHASLEMLPKVSLREYADLLPDFDLGLSLMLTPHPSLPPLEMAAAGLVVVTNTFANKTADKLRHISSNILPVEPTIEATCQGLADAGKAVFNTEARLQGSRVAWSQDWDRSFHPALMRQIVNALE